MKNVILFLLLSISFSVNAQILIDEEYNDWNSVQTLITDPESDGSGNIDFTEMKITNDSEYLYYRFNTGKELNLQDNSKIYLYIDIDNNPGTGIAVNGTGADISYDFGNRTGYYHRNSQIIEFFHDDCGMISLPTVTSSNFEMAFKRKFNAGSYLIVFGNKIRTVLAYNISGGDKIPDQSGGYLYQMNSSEYVPHLFRINKNNPSHLRIMSYNVLQDGIFENEPPYRRKIKAIQPDILCFQEIYDHTSGEMNSKVKNWFGGNWYDAKIGSDIIIVSKYPITKIETIGGNGAFLLNYNGQEILIINVHLYCCDNDKDRQTEADEIMQFIRNAKNKTGSFQLKQNTPVIITGDTNFVGLNQQRKTLLQGDIVSESVFGKDFLPDWDFTFFEDSKPLTTGYPGSFTWKSDFSTYPAGRLDYIIYSGAVLQLENSFVLNTDLLSRDILDQYQLNNEDSFNASDHLPIVSDFSFRDISLTYDSGNSKDLISIYPNPVSDNLNIKIQNPDDVEIMIFNHLGELAYKEAVKSINGINSLDINISDLHAGFYTAIVFNKHSNTGTTVKFIKI